MKLKKKKKQAKDIKQNYRKLSASGSQQLTVIIKFLSQRVGNDFLEMIY